MERSVAGEQCAPGTCVESKGEMACRRMVDLQAEVLRAIAHPVRIQILLFLRDGERCVCEFEPLLGLRQPNISQHLSILRGARLVATRRDGLRIMYRIVDGDLVRVLDTVDAIVRRQGAELAAALCDSALGEGL